MVTARRLVFNAMLLAIPGLAGIPPIKRRLARDEIGTGGSDSPRYCYSVWLRHMVKAHANGLKSRPQAVAELGPGDSLGIGCAALLCGAEKYYALDTVAHDNLTRNLAVLDALVELFKSHAPIPDDTEFTKVRPRLQSYGFPDAVLTPAALAENLTTSRIERIKYSIQNPNAPDSMIRYSVPWLSSEAVEKEAVDLVISQAVLEHVDNLPGAYEAMAMWLRKGGYVSHVIDFKCHGTAGTWDGHWAYSDLMWRIVRGKRIWLINREPCSTHMDLLRKKNFNVVDVETETSVSNVSRPQLAKRFRNIADTDRSTSEVFVQAVRA